LDRGRRISAWFLAGIAIALDFAACASGAIGCLPWDWKDCLTDCQEHSECRQAIPHDLKLYPKKDLTVNTSWGTINTVRRSAMANFLDTDKQIAVISALAEGSSIRSIERITGIHRDTIMRLGVKVGQGCTALMDRAMQDLPCKRLEMDELWGFIGKKQRNVRPTDSPSYGDVWTFCAIDADTKLVPAFRVGKRDMATANAFVQDVASRMKNRVQLSTDGLRAYVNAVEEAFGADVDYAQIVKVYGQEERSEARRYSPPSVIGSEKTIIVGKPDESLISTSYAERLNATTRQHMRRLTRLTMAFSKKLENFEASVGLHFAYYNFVRRHSTLRCTPAMAAGVTGRFWSVGELVEASA
jgi:IS1 family transposase